MLTNALSSRLFNRSACVPASATTPVAQAAPSASPTQPTPSASSAQQAPTAEYTSADKPAVAALAVTPLGSARLAHRFEAMRAASAAYRQRNGHGPKLFLVNWGALRRHKARADFTRDFFETGGFGVIASAGFTDAAEATAALQQSGARVAVLCGHDEDYAAHAATVFAALRKGCPEVKLLLAGAPGELENALRQAGMDDAISIRSNNLAVNETYLQFLGALG